jgi:cell division protein FtsB
MSDHDPKPSRRPTAARADLGGRVLRFGLVFVVSALLLNSLVGARGLPAMLQARRDYRALASDLERLKAENAELRRAVRRLREDPRAVEELAREELGLIAPGEKLFIIRDVPPAGQTPR